MDRYRLEYEMKKKGVSVNDMCNVLHISKSGYYRRMSGKTQFTLDEIQQIVDYLALNSPMGIFFKEKVS